MSRPRASCVLAADRKKSSYRLWRLPETSLRDSRYERGNWHHSFRCRRLLVLWRKNVNVSGISRMSWFYREDGPGRANARSASGPVTSELPFCGKRCRMPADLLTLSMTKWPTASGSGSRTSPMTPPRRPNRQTGHLDFRSSRSDGTQRSDRAGMQTSRDGQRPRHGVRGGRHLHLSEGSADRVEPHYAG